MAKIRAVDGGSFVIEDVSEDELGLLARGLFHDHTKASDAFNTCADRGCPCGGYDNEDEPDENDDLYTVFSDFIDDNFATVDVIELDPALVALFLGAFGFDTLGIELVEDDDDLPF